MKVTFRMFILTILLIVVTISCNQKTTEYQYPPSDGRVIGTVHGIVQDRNTNVRLAGVNIYYVSNGSIRVTNSDSLGYYSITNLYSGEYELTFKSTTEYAVTKASFYVPGLDEIGADMPSGKDYSYSIVEDVYLQKRNAGITGIVYARKSPQELVAASGVKVIADFGYFGVDPALYETTTNNEGVFTFDKNLPATSFAYVYTLPFTLGGVDYSAAAASEEVDLMPEVIVTAGNIIAETSTIGPVLLISPFGLDDFPTDGDIQLVFSKSMNTSTFEITMHRDYSSGEELFFEQTWSNNNTSLNLDPYVILRENTYYYININGQSEDNASFSTSGYFKTKGPDAIQFIYTNLEFVDGYYTDEFPVDGNIELGFNLPVDTSLSSILLRNYNTYGYEDFTLSLSSDEMTITIDPVDSLAFNTQYYLQSTVYSQAGDYVYVNIYFGTEGE